MLYINALPDISLESLDKIADAERPTYLQIWDDVQTRSIEIFITDVANELRKRFRLKTIKQTHDLGRVINPTSPTPAAAKYRGFTNETTALEFSRTSFSSWGSNLQVIPLQSVSLYSPVNLASDATVAIKVIDLDTYKVLDAFTLTGIVSGWNDYEMNRYYSSRRIAVVYDATLIDGASLKIPDNIINAFSGSLHLINCDCEGMVRGIETDSLTIPFSSTYGKNTFGLTGVFGIGCKFDFLVCNNKRAFASSLWYLEGSEIMLDRVFNKTRTNKWTMDSKRANALRDYYLNRYQETLESVTQGIDLDLSDECLECNQTVTAVYQTP